MKLLWSLLIAIGGLGLMAALLGKKLWKPFTLDVGTFPGGLRLVTSLWGIAIASNRILYRSAVFQNDAIILSGVAQSKIVVSPGIEDGTTEITVASAKRKVYVVSGEKTDILHELLQLLVRQ